MYGHEFGLIYVKTYHLIVVLQQKNSYYYDNYCIYGQILLIDVTCCTGSLFAVLAIQ